MLSVRTLISSVTLMVAAAGANTASAQSPSTLVLPTATASDTVSSADSTTNTGPRMAPTGVRRQSAAAGQAAMASQPQSMGKPMALMIVGGAAIVLGAVIGGDIGTLFMIGGTVSLLIGLYQYVK